jgi:hypothetical protein
MREIIDLVEAVDWLRTNPTYMVDAVKNWSHRSGMGDSDGGSTMTADEIGAAQERFLALSSGPLTVYRAMIISPYAVDAGDALGYAWTLDPRYAVPYNYTGRFRGRGNTLVFTAQVEPSAVDWLATLALVNGSEDEIRLKDLQSFVVTRIVDDHGEDVREDLWGSTFRSGPVV